MNLGIDTLETESVKHAWNSGPVAARRRARMKTPETIRSNYREGMGANEKERDARKKG